MNIECLYPTQEKIYRRFPIPCIVEVRQDETKDDVSLSR